MLQLNFDSLLIKKKIQTKKWIFTDTHLTVLTLIEAIFQESTTVSLQG